MDICNSEPRVDAALLSAAFQRAGKVNALVESFSIDEESIIRGKHSMVVRLNLKYSGPHDGLPKSVLVKRAKVADLEERSTEKWHRDITSYRSEAYFFEKLAEGQEAAGIRVPKPYHVHNEFHKDDIKKSSFLVVMEDLVEYQHHLVMNEDHARICLKHLAKVHAFYWESPELADVRQNMWPGGAFWTLEKRADGEHQKLQSEWEKFVLSFEKEDPEFFGKDSVKAMGSRLVKFVDVVSAKMVPPADGKWGTLVHGDFKTANIFFPRQAQIDAGVVNDIACIDWQWSGAGLGILDVMYLIQSSFSMETMENEDALLEEYHDMLMNELSSRGKSSNGYTYEEMMKLYKYATVDYLRVVIVYMWGNVSPESCIKNANSVNRCSHNRSIPHALALAKRCDTLLCQLESNGNF